MIVWRVDHEDLGPGLQIQFREDGDMCLPRSGARYQYDDDTVDNLHNGNRYSVRREGKKQGGSDPHAPLQEGKIVMR